VKEVNSTWFGLIIAYLLPGLAGFFSASFFNPQLKRVLKAFMTADANVGLFLLVILSALTAGLLVTVFRWILFERLLLKNHRLPEQGFAKLSDSNKLNAFRAAVDEHYRYHQFWGGMAIVIPVGFVGWAVEMWAITRSDHFCFILIGTLALEIAAGFAASDAFKNYVKRGTAILT